MLTITVEASNLCVYYISFNDIFDTINIYIRGHNYER